MGSSGSSAENYRRARQHGPRSAGIVRRRVWRGCPDSRRGSHPAAAVGSGDGSRYRDGRGRNAAEMVFICSPLDRPRQPAHSARSREPRTRHLRHVRAVLRGAGDLVVGAAWSAGLDTGSRGSAVASSQPQVHDSYRDRQAAARGGVQARAPCGDGRSLRDLESALGVLRDQPRSLATRQRGCQLGRQATSGEPTAMNSWRSASVLGFGTKGQLPPDLAGCLRHRVGCGRL